jgi:acyl-CoA thioesterase
MEKILELFSKDKFSKNCGISVIEMAPGYAKCQMEITGNHLNGIGTLMGGATFTLADFAFSLAANSHGIVAVSTNANISFLKKCTSGKVIAIATEVSRSHHLGVYRVSVTNEQDEQIADFTGTCYFMNTKNVTGNK